MRITVMCGFSNAVAANKKGRPRQAAVMVEKDFSPARPWRPRCTLPRFSPHAAFGSTALRLLPGVTRRNFVSSVSARGVSVPVNNRTSKTGLYTDITKS